MGYSTTLSDDPDRSQPAKIRQSREPEPSTINEKTIADFTRVVEQLEVAGGLIALAALNW